MFTELWLPTVLDSFLVQNIKKWSLKQIDTTPNWDILLGSEIRMRSIAVGLELQTRVYSEIIGLKLNMCYFPYIGIF